MTKLVKAGEVGNTPIPVKIVGSELVSFELKNFRGGVVMVNHHQRSPRGV